MRGLLRYLPLLVRHSLSRPRLDRVPESAPIMDNEASVLAYDRVMTTVMTVPYAIGLEALRRVHPLDGGHGIDLAPGPGHFTLSLARAFSLARLVGVDLAPGMVETANKNAEQAGLAGKASFRRGDVTDLRDFRAATFDVATFTFAAHHLPDLAAVGRALAEADRVVKPTGVVMVLDLARLNTRSLAEAFVQVTGRDYVNRGLTAFYEDYRQSMLAAWTADELRAAVPAGSRRRWVQSVLRGLPGMQLLIGLPVGAPLAAARQTALDCSFLCPAYALPELALTRLLFRAARRYEVPPRLGRSA